MHPPRNRNLRLILKTLSQKRAVAVTPVLSMALMLAMTPAVHRISEQAMKVMRVMIGMSSNGKLPNVRSACSIDFAAHVNFSRSADLKRTEGGKVGSDSEDDRPKKKKPATNGKSKSGANGKSRR